MDLLKIPLFSHPGLPKTTITCSIFSVNLLLYLHSSHFISVFGRTKKDASRFDGKASFFITHVCCQSRASSSTKRRLANMRRMTAFLAPFFLVALLSWFAFHVSCRVNDWQTTSTAAAHLVPGWTRLPATAGRRLRRRSPLPPTGRWLPPPRGPRRPRP